MVFFIFHSLGLGIAAYFCLVSSQGISKLLVELKWYNGLRKLIQVPSQNVSCIVYRVPGPVQAFAVSLGGIEDGLKILDTFCGAAESKDAFDVRC